MNYFIKLFILTFPVIFTLNAHADDFDYPDASTCESKLEEYKKKAIDLAYKHEWGSKPWKGFMNMGLLFGNIASPYARSDERCTNGQCVWTTSANCSLVSIKKIWKSKMIPILDKEVNQYLNKGKYDPGLKPRTVYTVECTYPEGQKHYNQCKLVKH